MKNSWLTKTFAIGLALGLGLLTIGCGSAETTEEAEEPAAEETAEEAAAQEEMADGLDPSILQDERRPEDEIAQDEARKPIELYEFFGVEPGMTVADLWPGSGYNTHLLSSAVGENGQVYSVLGFYTQFREGAMAEALRTRVQDMGLDNVTVVDDIPEVPAGSLDVAISVRNYHDIYGFGGDPEATVTAIFEAVKPGGVVGIVDVATDREGWDEETHRLNKQTVIDDFTAGGFELVDESDMLANPEDDHSAPGFQQGRQTMDRYVLKFQKPAGNGGQE